MRKQYTRRYHGDKLTISADLTDAAAPILMAWDDSPMRSTPFQTADARHNLAAAFKLCREYRF